MNEERVHWLAFKMSQLTSWDIEMAHAWISTNHLNSPKDPVPVARGFLYKLLEIAEKALDNEDKND